jgi:hypothetical protein
MCKCEIAHYIHYQGLSALNSIFKFLNFQIFTLEPEYE